MCKMSKNHDGQPDPYGLHTPGLSRAAGGEATCYEKVAFLQTWLFFGALAEAQEVCNLPVSRDDYSVDFFNTAHLNGLPLRLYLASQSLSSDKRKMLKEELYAIARQVQLMITRVSEVDDEEDYTLVQCEVLFSIQILLRILALALLCHSQQPFLDLKVDLKLSIADPSQDWKCEGQMSMAKFVYERLLGNGWCKSELSHLLGGFDVSIAACYLNRPYAIKNHDTCSETTCRAYQISDSSYRTLHVGNCECGFVHVDQAKLKDALSKNKIPKIVVTDELQLSVVEGDEVDYIAFSHVWADGLGNPFDNALPRCQIRRLRDLAINLRNRFKLDKDKAEVAIWMDTLCIPVAEELKEYRKRAIRLLGRTYTKAVGVLVLDRELSHFESSKASILELAIRVICCGWLKRLWTLQEASLAIKADGIDTLYIQMADGPAYWNRRSKCFESGPSDPEPAPHRVNPLSFPVKDEKTDLVYGLHLETVMQDRLPSIREIQEPRFGTRFQSIMNAVQNRSTSKREDEPICMASLLGLDLQQILDARDADERMMKFYRILHEIPKAVVFADFGIPDFLSRNFTMAPYRWAPRSLLSLEQPMEINLAFSAMNNMDHPSYSMGSCEHDGFHIQHPGYVFSETHPITIKRKSVIFDKSDGKMYSLSLALSDGSPQTIGPIERCVLIFKTDICSDVIIATIESEMALEAGSCYYVAIIGHGTVRPQYAGKLGRDDQSVGLGLMYGSSTAGDQRWCFT
ncbi:hypothetical protein ACQKWADRAFT_307353 [Trichoderma austrokoningii]